MWLWHFLVILTFSCDFAKSIFINPLWVPSAGLGLNFYHGHSVACTLIETPIEHICDVSDRQGLLMCVYCPYNFIDAKDRSWVIFLTI